MKKLFALLLVLSMGVFTVGCKPADEAADTTDTGTTTVDGDDAIDDATDDLTDDGADESLEIEGEEMVDDAGDEAEVDVEVDTDDVEATDGAE